VEPLLVPDHLQSHELLVLVVESLHHLPEGALPQLAHDLVPIVHLVMHYQLEVSSLIIKAIVPVESLVEFFFVADGVGALVDVVDVLEGDNLALLVVAEELLEHPQRHLRSHGEFVLGGLFEEVVDLHFTLLPLLLFLLGPLFLVEVVYLQMHMVPLAFPVVETQLLLLLLQNILLRDGAGLVELLLLGRSLLPQLRLPGSDLGLRLPIEILHLLVLLHARQVAGLVALELRVLAPGVADASFAAGGLELFAFPIRAQEVDHLGSTVPRVPSLVLVELGLGHLGGLQLVLLLLVHFLAGGQDLLDLALQVRCVVQGAVVRGVQLGGQHIFVASDGDVEVGAPLGGVHL